MTAHLAAQLQDALGASYRVEQQLDGGGMSRLYLATQLGLNRRVVIKVLPPDLINEMSVARFKREIDVTVRLQHPNILPVLTAGSLDDVLYYITPYILGESLRARITRDRKLPLDDVVRMLREAGDALAYAHSRGVVHRDVKPENILLSEGHAILADFGIASALSTSGGGGSLTGSGMRPGTPAYMAPELPSDERADVYALGVVGYEMLTGALPPRGASAKQIVAARGTLAGDSKPVVRRVAEVLANALEMEPERRFATTAEFMTALVVLPQSTRINRLRAWTASAILVAATLVIATEIWRSARNAPAPAIDRNPYLVAPFGGTDTLLAAMMSRRVGDAFGEWQGVSVIADQRVHDVFPRANQAPSLDSARDMARRVGAHTVVLGNVEHIGDSVVIRVSQYGVSDSAPMRTARSVFAPGVDTNLTTAVRHVVNSLLRDGAELPWRNASDTRRPVLASWTAYDRGRGALNRWDLAAAEPAFHEAIAGDPQNAYAHLWLAQTLVWADRDTTGPFRSVARQALAARSDLRPRDSLLATALWALADSQYVGACVAFRAMVKQDSSDLAGWTGLADCQRRDPLVIVDSRSPSGWAFRGSWSDAARKYLRAAEVAPSAVDPSFRGWLMKRLSDVLYTTTNHYRAGRTQGPRREQMWGAPFLSGDTLAFAPIPVKEIVLGRSAVAQERVEAAVTQNLATLRRAAEQWVLRAPKSAAAYAGLASLAEATGGFAFLGEARISALQAAQRAQAFTVDSTERFRLGIVQVRLLIKTEQFAAARDTAESILAVAQSQSRGSAELAGLAVLVGRPLLAARLLEENNTDPKVAGRFGIIELPPAVLKERLGLLAYAALGSPADSLHVLAVRADNAIRNYFSNDSLAAEARAGVLATPLSLVFPLEGPLLITIAANDRMIRAEQLALTDRPAAARVLRALIGQFNRHAPAQAMDGPYRMAVVALTLGDTASAIAVLDRALGALPTIGEALFKQVPQVAGLMRAMMLRADLATRRHETATAARWGRAVTSLWSGADPGLRPVVDRMRLLAAQT